MAEIRILPEILSNKIAAGEVVDRPVSVVKELVENALDANATQVTADIVRGGRERICIFDNGVGMSRDNAILCIERYATSKIYSDADLFSISTFGFRGEALPSIASVSEFTLTTRERTSDVATRIRIKGGKVLEVSDAGAPPGTMVDVRHLYFNTPARRKFLKSEDTEMGHIADVFAGMALCSPDIQFKLVHNTRLVRQYYASDNSLDRVADVLGRDASGQLIPVALDDGLLRVEGYVSVPGFTRATPQKIHLFVNRRMIQDRGLVAALFKGYSGRIMKGRFPLAVLFLTLPHDQVDVNVHPAKLQVRFAEQGRVYARVAAAVRDALISDKPGRQGAILPPVPILPVMASGPGPEASQFKEPDPHQQSLPDIPLRTSESAPERFFRDTASPGSRDQEPSKAGNSCMTGFETFDTRSKGTGSRVSESMFQWGRPSASRKTETPGQTAKPKEIVKPKKDLEPGKVIEPGKTGTGNFRPPGDQIPAPHLEKSAGLSGIRVVGQVLGTYILAEGPEGILLIDQHAAHERIAYEKLKKRAGSFRPPSQHLLVPETLELSFKEAALMQSLVQDLHELGFDLEAFGETTFLIKAVPALIDDKAAGRLLHDMVETILESGADPRTGNETQAWLDTALTLMACHSSIRGNQSLEIREMAALVRDLENCENPEHCPHGRPTRVLWTRTQIEKLFKRLV